MQSTINSLFLYSTSDNPSTPFSLEWPGPGKHWMQNFMYEWKSKTDYIYLYNTLMDQKLTTLPCKILSMVHSILNELKIVKHIPISDNVTCGISTMLRLTLSQQPSTSQFHCPVPVTQSTIHSKLTMKLAYSTTKNASPSQHQQQIKGSRPEWCISSMICSRDTPLWSETLEIEGSQPKWCISSIIYSRGIPFWPETLEIYQLNS